MGTKWKQSRNKNPQSGARMETKWKQSRNKNSKVGQEAFFYEVDNALSPPNCGLYFLTLVRSARLLFDTPF